MKTHHGPIPELSTTKQPHHNKASKMRNDVKMASNRRRNGTSKFFQKDKKGITPPRIHSSEHVVMIEVNATGIG